MSNGGHTEAVQAWEQAYREIICNLYDYLSDPFGNRARPPQYGKEYKSKKLVKIRVYDFDKDGTNELIVGDCWSVAVFTFANGKAERIADLYVADWASCDKLCFKDGRILLIGSGYETTANAELAYFTFASLAFVNGQYVSGFYDEKDTVNTPTVNGKAVSIEEFDAIYSHEWTGESPANIVNTVFLEDLGDGWRVTKMYTGESMLVGDAGFFDFVSLEQVADEQTAAQYAGQRTWEEAYRYIICNITNYLSDPYHKREESIISSAGADIVGEEAYKYGTIRAGIYDFNKDGIYELVIHDGWSAAVYTFTEGRVELVSDVYIADWTSCDYLGFQDGRLIIEGSGSDGAAYGNFAYINGEYLTGYYDEYERAAPPRINGKDASIEDFDAIYSHVWTENSGSNRIAAMQLEYTDGRWKLTRSSPTTGEESIFVDEEGLFDFIKW